MSKENFPRLPTGNPVESARKIHESWRNFSGEEEESHEQEFLPQECSEQEISVDVLI